MRVLVHTHQSEDCKAPNAGVLTLQLNFVHAYTYLNVDLHAIFWNTKLKSYKQIITAFLFIQFINIT